jgi:hypothetical protein
LAGLNVLPFQYNVMAQGSAPTRPQAEPCRSSSIARAPFDTREAEPLHILVQDLHVSAVVAGDEDLRQASARSAVIGRRVPALGLAIVEDKIRASVAVDVLLPHERLERLELLRQTLLAAAFDGSLHDARQRRLGLRGARDTERADCKQENDARLHPGTPNHMNQNQSGPAKRAYPHTHYLLQLRSCKTACVVNGIRLSAAKPVDKTLPPVLWSH